MSPQVMMMNLFNHSIRCRLVIVTVLSGLAWLPARAYESYHNPNTPGQGYCAQCHSGFLGGQSSATHALHTGGADPLTSNCNSCHTGSLRDNPLTMWSGGTGGANLGCMGCHGLDYGETIQANYRGFATLGQHKQSGYGLRRHHARNNVTICATCHTNDVNVAPYGENVVDTGLGFTTHYYNRTDVGVRGLPLNPCNNEDSLNPSNGRGLDNDGDGVYDAADPDCLGTRATTTLQVSSTNAVISWPYTFDGWHVQVSTGLAGSWSDLSVVPREVGTNWTVTLPQSSGPSFYRLFKNR